MQFNAAIMAKDLSSKSLSRFYIGIGALFICFSTWAEVIDRPRFRVKG